MAGEVTRALARPLERVLGWLQRDRGVPAPFAGLRWPGSVPHEFRTGAWQRNLTCAAEDLTAFSAVYACVTIISGDIAKLGLKLWRDLEGGGRVKATTHPYWRLFHHPNDWQSVVEFVQQWVTSVLLTGNAYVLMRRDARGVVQSLHVLDPRRVRVYVSEQGEPAYRVSEDPLAAVFELQEFVPARDMIHDRMNPLFHPLVGVSPIISAAGAASAGNHILAQSDAFFGQMSRPSGLLIPQTPGVIPPQTIKELKDTWTANYGGAGNAGRVAVLPANMDWKPMVMTAVDAQLIEQLKFSVEDVARAYRVPGFMLGDLTKVSYRNAEQLTRIYHQGCLQYHLERIEWRLDASLELATDVSAEFDLTALFRMESDVRATTSAAWLAAGVKSINEVRAEEGLTPVKGGEKPRLQVQYQPLDAPPPAVPPPTEPPPPAGAPAEDPEEDPPEPDEERAARLRRGVLARMAEAA